MDIKDLKFIEYSKNSMHAYLNLLRVCLILQEGVHSINERYETSEQAIEQNQDARRIADAYFHAVKAIAPLVDSYKGEGEDALSPYSTYINHFKEMYANIEQCDCPACDGSLERELKDKSNE